MLVNTDGINCAFSLSCFEFIAKNFFELSICEKMQIFGAESEDGLTPFKLDNQKRCIF